MFRRKQTDVQQSIVTAGYFSNWKREQYRFAPIFQQAAILTMGICN